MKLDATPDTIRAVAEAMQLAAVLDDRAPKPTEARVAAWAEQIERHRLERADLLDAVQAFYDNPHDRAITIGDLIADGRRIKRDRLDREADAERDQRAADLEAKADAEAIAAAVSFGRSRKRTPRLEAAERALMSCVNRQTAMNAISEYTAAKVEASKS